MDFENKLINWLFFTTFVLFNTIIMDLANDISENIRRIRKLKNLSQKEVAMAIDIAQAQYSVIESGKNVPTLPTLEKIAKVFETDITQLLKKPDVNDEDVNLSILEKVKLIDTLEKEEKNSLLKIIDIAIAKKRMKDNLASIMSEWKKFRDNFATFFKW